MGLFGFFRADERAKEEFQVPPGAKHVEGSDRVIQHDAVADVTYTKFEVQFQVVEPGVLLTGSRFLTRVTTELPDTIHLALPYDHPPYEGHSVHAGLCAVEVGTNLHWYDVSGLDVPGGRTPDDGAWRNLPFTLAHGNGDPRGNRLTVAQAFDWLETCEFDGAEIERAFGGDSVLLGLREAWLHEVLTQFDELDVRAKIGALDQVAACQLVPGFTSKDTGHGMAVDLCVEALQGAAREASMETLVALSRSLAW